MSKRKPSSTPEAPPRVEHRSSKEMHRSRRRQARKWSIAIWGVQAVVSAIFLMQGIMKLLIPNEQLGLTMPWVSMAPGWLVAIIGLAEIVVAGLLIVPALLRYKPHLGIIAAWVLMSFMVVAITYHAVKAEYGAIPYNAFAMLMTAFILWGRTQKDRIEPKEPVHQPPPLSRNGFF